MNINGVKDVFNVIEEGDKSRWLKIGQAYCNPDGSLNVLLDVFPRDGKLQIRERRETITKSEARIGTGGIYGKR